MVEKKGCREGEDDGVDRAYVGLYVEKAQCCRDCVFGSRPKLTSPWLCMHLLLKS